jgi:polyhydroxyalkanoate synthesis regulator phasin
MSERPRLKKIETHDSAVDSPNAEPAVQVPEALNDNEAPFVVSSEYIRNISDGSKPESRSEFRKVLGGMIAKIESRQNRKSAVKERIPAAANDNDNESKERVASNDNQAEVSLKDMKSEIELAKRAGVHEQHAKVHELEAKFFDLYKKRHTEGSVISKLRHRKEFSEITKQYDEARLEHAKALQSSVEQRLATTEREAKLLAQYEGRVKQSHENIHGGLFDEKGRVLTFEAYKAVENEKLSKRYNGWIRYNEVHKPKIEAKQKARFENLDKKGQNIFLKAVSWYPKAMHGLENKFGKNKVRAARLLLTAGLVVGGATVAGAGVGVAALLGTFAVLRSGAFMIGGSAAIGGADKGFRSTLGKSRRAKRQETHGENIASLDDLARHDTHHKKGSEAGIESSARKVQLAAGVVTALVAFGFSHEAAAQVAHLDSLHRATDQLSNGGGGGHVPPGGSGESHAPISKISDVHKMSTAQEAKGSTQSHIPPPNPEDTFHAVHVTPGTGADKLFSNFHKLIDDHQMHTPLIDYIVAHNSHVLAQKLGFPEHNANGYMQPGDSLSMEKNQLVFHRGAHRIVLMNENPDGTVTIDPHAHEHIAKLTSHHHHLAAHHEQTHASSHEEVSANVANGELPSGMNPDSAAAADYLMQHHNPASMPTPTSEHIPPASTGIHAEAAATPDHAPVIPHIESTVSESTPTSALSGFEHAPASVSAVANSEAWSSFNHANSMNVFMYPAEPGSTADTFHQSLFSVMRESGVGPTSNESVEQYLTRATQVIQDHIAKGTNTFDTHPGIYETTDHHLQVHGGDLSARLLLAHEYSLQHPDVEVDVENPGGSTPLIVYSAKAIQDDYYPPAEIKATVITPTSKLIF